MTWNGKKILQAREPIILIRLQSKRTFFKKFNLIGTLKEHSRCAQPFEWRWVFERNERKQYRIKNDCFYGRYLQDGRICLPKDAANEPKKFGKIVTLKENKITIFSKVAHVILPFKEMDFIFKVSPQTQLRQKKIIATILICLMSDCLKENWTLRFAGIFPQTLFGCYQTVCLMVW